MLRCTPRQWSRSGCPPTASSWSSTRCICLIWLRRTFFYSRGWKNSWRASHWTRTRSRRCGKGHESHCPGGVCHYLPVVVQALPKVRRDRRWLCQKKLRNKRMPNLNRFLLIHAVWFRLERTSKLPYITTAVFWPQNFGFGLNNHELLE